MYYLLIFFVPASGMYKAVPPTGFGCMKLHIICLGFGDMLQTDPAPGMLGFGD
jgi:hypothetical protein